jgi:hypothetical protein
MFTEIFTYTHVAIYVYHFNESYALMKYMRTEGSEFESQ